MGRLKQKKQDNKIDGKANAAPLCCSEQYPWFSFKDLTTNSSFNLDNLPAGKAREITLASLFERLNEISSKSWVYWHQNQKSLGLETMTYDNLYFSAHPDAVISKDTKVYIFRFDTYLGFRKGRIIGYKKSPCSVLHIIGFDINFSAYDHD